MCIREVDSIWITGLPPCVYRGRGHVGEVSEVQTATVIHAPVPRWAVSECLSEGDLDGVYYLASLDRKGHMPLLLDELSHNHTQNSWTKCVSVLKGLKDSPKKVNEKVFCYDTVL